jgi:ribosomal protein S18 acetylase RimI-like enzyme
VDPVVSIRKAGEEDGPILAEIERQTPIVFHGGSLFIDRGDDYFAAARLMEDFTVLLAEVNGEPAGAFCGALHPALVAGIPRQMLYIHHSRILPDYQRLGIGRKLAAAMTDCYRDRGVDSQYWYISKTNARSQAFAARAENRWSISPLMLALDPTEFAGKSCGRPAKPADAAEVVAILNTAHEGEEMFVPYTPESFSARLSRAPWQYGWDRVWTTGSAVVGVWPEGESITVRLVDTEGQRVDARGAAVLDYGCLPGAEADLLALIAAWSTALSDTGITELSIFTSPGARLANLLLGREVDRSPFDFWTPSLPEPPGAPARGLYVDHIYF